MLRGIEKRIVIAKRSFQRGGFFSRVAGDNAVDQRGTERVCRLHPVGKRRRKMPLLRIPQHQGFERLTVIVDKLARDNYPALIRRPGKLIKALEQQARQFGRKAHRRCIIHAVCRVIAYSGFGGIRKHKADIRIVRQRQIRREVLIRIDFVIHRPDKPRLAHRLTLLV